MRSFFRKMRNHKRRKNRKKILADVFVACFADLAEDADVGVDVVNQC